MLRQLYPILISITVALAIGVYLNPGEARVWIRQASHWGTEVLCDTLRTASALADETRATAPQPGYASTTPGAQPNAAYPPVSQDPTWAYVADGRGPRTTLGAPTSPPAAANGYPQPSTASRPGVMGPQGSATSPNVFPRVLASGASSGVAPYQNQTTSPYPVRSEAPPATTGSSPYTTAAQTPLRPNMEKTAPWATSSSQPNTPSPGPAYAGSQVKPRVSAGYPKVQWAGDWRDYRGVPETVKPTDQSQIGYLPPPDVNSTTATVNRYLPNQPPSPPPSLPNMQPAQPGPSSSATTAPPQYGQTAGNPALSMQAPAVQYQPGAPLPAQHGTIPAPYGLAPQAPLVNAAPSYSYGQAPPQAGPVAPASPYHTATTPPTQRPTYPTVASVPPRSALPGTQPGPSVQEAAIPFGAQMESPDPVADLTLCEGAQILARVGSEVVLGSEVLPNANEALAGIEGIDKASESDLAKAREQFVKRLLPQHIEMKLLYVDAKRNLPPEAIENIQDQLGKRFEEVEVSERLKKLKLSSRRELEEKLGEWGTSLEHEKHAFIEKAIAQQWVFEKLRKEEEATHEQLLDYYQEHAIEYDHPTRVRWEHLEVTFKKHPDKREAWQLIAVMGNAVQQGHPFAQVAKERSEGVMASKGGARDWLTQGSLKSEVLDQNLFSLPAGTLSPILEDETGFHIVRIVERENAYRTPFEEIQGDIREKIKGERRQERLQEFVTQLREEIPVTTVFDQQTADSGAGERNAGRRF